MNMLALLTIRPVAPKLGSGRVHVCEGDEEPMESIESERVCNTCEASKPLADYYYNKNRKTFSMQCKKCAMARSAQKRKERREREG